MKELQLIEYIKKRAGASGKGVKTGIGDDCAVLDYDADNYLLWAADMLIEDTHFIVGKDAYNKIGRKAVAVNISDIAAMGGTPKYITVSIGVPSKLKMATVQAIYDGIFGLCKEFGIKVIGGDTNRSEKLVIDVSIMGTVKKKQLLLRSGGKQGDLILITGLVRNGKKEHLDFIPRIKESEFLVKNYSVNSMIDTSDGIALDISRICMESNVGCIIYPDVVPLSTGLTIEDALYYGESFELLFTMNSREALKLNKSNKFSIIGEIRNKKEGLLIIEEDGRIKKLEKKGFEHLY